MKIQVCAILRGTNLCADPGDVVTVEDNIGKGLVKVGAAIEILEIIEVIESKQPVEVKIEKPILKKGR